MNPQERYLFDYNAMISNNNTQSMVNATNANTVHIDYLYDYLSWHGLWWAFVLAFWTFCLLVLEKKIQDLDERVEYLEERLPEREPLLAKC
jgi:hypothetical protein